MQTINPSWARNTVLKLGNREIRNIKIKMKRQCYYNAETNFLSSHCFLLSPVPDLGYKVIMTLFPIIIHLLTLIVFFLF